MKEFVDFNSRNSVKYQCMGKYSIINTINKKILDYITTCLQSKGMSISKIVGPSTAFISDVYSGLFQKKNVGVVTGQEPIQIAGRYPMYFNWKGGGDYNIF